MKVCLILIFYILLATNCLHSQNKTTSNGLKTGFWKTEYNQEFYEFNCEGQYKVISIKNLDTIPEVRFANKLTVVYKNDTTWISYEQRKGNSIEVKDGLWKYYDTTGLKLEYLVKYNRGIRLWSKDFNLDGSLFSHSYTNFKRGITFYEYYRMGKLFKQRFYLPATPNDETIVFYPKTRLFISNAEPYFDYNFLSKESIPQNIQIACKKSLKIISITPHSSNFQVRSSLPLPIDLKKQDTLLLQLNFRPSPATTMEEDTIVIKTLENGKVHEYLICALTSAVHVDYQNVEHISKIELSQTRDRYLLIDQLGTQTDACVQTQDENICFELISGLSPHISIDLKAFKPGAYSVYVGSCNTFGSFTLVITE